MKIIQLPQVLLGSSLVTAFWLGFEFPHPVLSSPSQGSVMTAKLSPWQPPTSDRQPSHKPGRRRVAGGGRGCDPDLLAILPSTTFGLVGVESPELFLYVASQNIAAGEVPGAQLEIFVNVPKSRSVLYRMDIENFPRDTLFSVPWPTAVPLEPGQVYHWRFALNCQPYRFVQGSLSLDGAPLAPDLSTALATAAPLEKARFYLKQGWWYDAIKVLWHHQNTEPEAKDLWQELLEAEDYR